MSNADPPAPRPPHLHFGSFGIDVAGRMVRCHGRPLELTPKAFDTLVALVAEPGVVLSKETLLERVWPGAFVSEATLTQNVYTLRKVLAAADPDAGPVIETVPRRGYRFAPPVALVAATTPVEGRSGQPQAAPTSPREDTGRSRVEAIRSIAVLPLRALGSVGEDASLLGLGLADALITRLSNLRQLTVRSTSAILPYADTASDVMEHRDVVTIGRALGVDGVLEGTVQQAHERLRVTVQLVSVADGSACWAERFQGGYDDVFDAQDAIAGAVVAGLRLRLTRQEAARLEQRSTDDLGAYRAFVRGRYRWNRRTAVDLQEAITCFGRATALDPGYAQAWAGLADAWILLPMYGGASSDDAFRHARDAARRARSLDERLAEAHTALAYTDFVHARRWRTAEDGFHRALACNPAYPTAHQWYAFLLAALGRNDEALAHATRARELDPLSSAIHTDLAMVHVFAGKPGSAVEELTALIETDPGFAYAFFALVFAEGLRGRYDQSIAAGRQALTLTAGAGAMHAALGWALATAGRSGEAREILTDLEALATSGRVPAQAAHRALVLVGLRDHDAAFDALRQACDEHSRFVAFLAVWPIFDALRNEPRFETLLRTVGLDAVRPES